MPLWPPILATRVQPSDSDLSLPALASAAGLSPGRLMHAFTESVGIPMRPYLLWLKLQRACALIVAGAPLGDAAHAAGFADAAHMTRTFRRMFGATPSRMRPRGRQPVGSSAASGGLVPSPP